MSRMQKLTPNRSNKRDGKSGLHNAIRDEVRYKKLMGSCEIVTQIRKDTIGAVACSYFVHVPFFSLPREGGSRYDVRR